MKRRECHRKNNLLGFIRLWGDYRDAQFYKVAAIAPLKVNDMAATPKGPQKFKIDYNIDRATYDEFIRQCGKKGFTPNIVVERLMRKYNESQGQLI